MTTMTMLLLWSLLSLTSTIRSQPAPISAASSNRTTNVQVSQRSADSLVFFLQAPGKAFLEVSFVVIEMDAFYTADDALLAKVLDAFISSDPWTSLLIFFFKKNIGNCFEVRSDPVRSASKNFAAL